MKPPIYSERIVTFSVIYHPYRRNTERFIRAFGAFEVNLQPGDDVLFTRHHHTYQDKDRTAPLLEMTKLLDQQTDCVCAVMEAPGGSHRPKDKADFADDVLQAFNFQSGSPPQDPCSPNGRPICQGQRRTVWHPFGFRNGRAIGKIQASSRSRSGAVAVLGFQLSRRRSGSGELGSGVPSLAPRRRPPSRYFVTIRTC